jgi:hypothetical protein
MTITRQRRVLAGLNDHPMSWAWVGVTSVVGGLIFGVVDFVWIKFVPYPAAELGNSSAVWAVVAFAAGRWIYRDATRAMVGATVLMIAGIVGYRLAGVVIQSDDVAGLRSPASFVWMAFGVVAGVVFGASGAFSREDGRRGAVCRAMPAAVLFSEAIIYLGRIGDPSYDDSAWNASINIALGLAVLWIVNRRGRGAGFSI